MEGSVVSVVDSVGAVLSGSASVVGSVVDSVPVEGAVDSCSVPVSGLQAVQEIKRSTAHSRHKNFFILGVKIKEITPFGIQNIRSLVKSLLLV